MPLTKLPRSRRGSPAGRIIMSTSRRLRRHGLIRSSAGLPSSPESGSAYLCQATRSRYPRLHRLAQPKSQAFQMDQICRPNPGFSETHLPQRAADIMRRTVDSRDLLICQSSASTTLADLLTPLLDANPFSTVRASFRWQLSDERDDGVADGRQAWLRRRSIDSFFPASLF